MVKKKSKERILKRIEKLEIVEYGLKEFLHGLLIGLFIGFFLALFFI